MRPIGNSVKNRFNTQPPEGGWDDGRGNARMGVCFNTQPPEGGWIFMIMCLVSVCGFNTQPPEGGWTN